MGSWLDKYEVLHSANSILDTERHDFHEALDRYNGDPTAFEEDIRNKYSILWNKRPHFKLHQLGRLSLAKRTLCVSKLTYHRLRAETCFPLINAYKS